MSSISNSRRPCFHFSALLQIAPVTRFPTLSMQTKKEKKKYGAACMFASYIAKKSGVPSLVPRKKKDLVSKEGLGCPNSCPSN